MAKRLQLKPLSMDEAKRQLFKKHGGPFDFPVRDVETARWAVEYLKSKNGITYSAMANAMGESASNFYAWRYRKGPRVRLGQVVIDWLNKDVQDISNDSAVGLSHGVKREPADEDVASTDRKTVDGLKTKASEKVQFRVQFEDKARTFLRRWMDDHPCTSDDLAKVIGVTSKDLCSWVSCGHVGKKVIDWMNSDGGGNHGDGGSNYGDGGGRSEHYEKLKKEKVVNVYIMTDTNQRFKVGHSTDPDRRIRELRTGNPSLKLLDRFPVSSAKAEKEAHKALEKYRWTRSLEWFYGPYNEIKPLVIEAIRGYMLPM